ncbi:MAG: hypothetical protein QOD81_351 [Solirubrobacteraceae bacterium]|jgi:hypothetical protein|nr:hypothetical protein [Solirubrobacteraceae bacterium]
MPTIDSHARWLGLCLVALAGSLVALSLLGPLVANVIHWRIRPTILSQLYGLDTVSLAVVAPVAVVAGVLSLRGRPLGALLAFGPAAYAIYMVPQYVLGPDYSHLAGNNERWFPLLLALFALGIVSAVLAWSQLAASEPKGSARAESLVARRLLPAAAAVVFVRYVPTLADWMSASPTATDYIAGPSFSWAIALLDLGVALPATAAVCIGYRHAASWARRALYALTGWFALVGAAVAGMAIAMQLRDDPAMSVPQMVLMTVLGGVLIALAAALYAPVLRRPAWEPRPAVPTTGRRDPSSPLGSAPEAGR